MGNQASADALSQTGIDQNFAHRCRAPTKRLSQSGIGRCTPSRELRITRWEHEAIIEAMQRRLDRKPEAMRLRRQTIQHVFGTLKALMGATHFKTRRLRNVASEMSLQVLTYNLKRAIALLDARHPASTLQAASRDVKKRVMSVSEEAFFATQCD